MTAYLTALGGDRYLPSEHAGGAWQPGELHFAPLGGLLTHAIERHRASSGGAPLVLSRIAFDILGFLALDEIAVRVQTRRPGRTIELTEATASIAGRDVAVARAWHSVVGDTGAVEGGSAAPLPSPELARPAAFDPAWGGGFVRSLDLRQSGDAVPGRSTAWVSSPLELLDGEAASPLARWLGLVDVVNGVAVRATPDAWMFPNLDLTVHLLRQPEGRWVGLDTTVAFGPSGQGITGAALHDERGHVGHAMQTLTVRPSPRA
ncbi:thioesterase family protein [Agrococcus jenensis]|uniref:Thioesterase superfamily protein n=1 Tax=Agrococcus jenensis TaxID=46353 RepID=A0A3N2AV45_9MICO|nr:thioesterase family protein [Agrococcus jenensis]ROR66901.1 thioesterase superfamily protein [Agrococcus jenensis]